jgi:hypothetical protein
MNPAQYFGPVAPDAGDGPASKARLLEEFREHPDDAVKFVRDRMRDPKNYQPRQEYRPPDATKKRRTP